MAGSGTIATLAAKIGVDTSAYQASMAGLHKPAQDAAGRIGQAGQVAGGSWARTWDTIEAGAARAGRRIGSDVGNPLALVGSAAAKFGGQITTSFLEAEGVTSKLAVSTNGLFMATSRTLDAVMLATAAYGKLSMVHLSFKQLNAATVGLSVAAGELGWTVGRLVSEVTGLDNALREKAAKPAQDFAKVLADDEVRFQSTVAQLQHLRTQLGLTGAAWVIPTAHTKENADRLAELSDRLLAVARGHRDAGAQITQFVNQQRAALTLHQQAIVTLENLREKFRRAYDVMTGSDVLNAMNKLDKDVLTLIGDGASVQEILAKMGSRIRELKDEAGNYRDLNMPEQFRDLADAMQDKTGLALEDWVRRWGTVSDAVSKAREGSKAALDKMADDLSSSVSGGLGRGVQEGTNAAAQALDDWAKRTKLVVPVELDLAEAQRQLDALKSGHIAPTGGFAR